MAISAPFLYGCDPYTSLEKYNTEATAAILKTSYCITHTR